MTNIKSEDGLTHDWDRSNPDEWHTDTAPRHMLGVLARIIGFTAFVIAWIGGAPTAPIVLPGFAVAAFLYGCDVTMNRKADR